jgi:antitoxin ParD1/3/4
MSIIAITNTIMSLNISLPIELENRVREHVASGMYDSVSEVIREALRLFETYQDVQSSHLANLKADIKKGVIDVKEKRINKMDVNAIKVKGRSQLKSKKKTN